MGRSTLSVLLLFLSAGFLHAQDHPAGTQLFQSGRQLFIQKNYSRAIQQLNEALSADPTAGYQPDARLLLTRAYLETSQPEPARREAERLIREFPRFNGLDSTWYYRAEATHRLGQPGAAADLWELTASNYPLSPLSPVSLLKAGRIQKELQQFDQARRIYLRLINDYPNVPEQLEAQSDLGELLYFLDEFEAARQRFQSIVNHPKATPAAIQSARLRLAEIYLNLKDPGSAENSLKNATITEAFRNRFEFVTAQIFIQQNQWEKGLPLAESILAKDPPDPAVYPRYAFLMARTYRRLQKYSQSIDWYLKILPVSRSEQRQFTARVEAASVLVQAGDTARALSLISEANRLYPGQQTPQSLVLEARLTDLTGKYETAFSLYKQFLEIYKDHPEADRVRYEAALLAWNRLKLRSLAIDLLTPLMVGDQSSALKDDAAWLTGLLYLESGFTGDAFRIWDQFPNTFPGSDYQAAIRSVMDTLTIPKLNTRDFTSGMADLVANLNPSNPKGTIHYGIGKLIFSTGIYLSTAASHLRNSLGSTELSPAQREDALYMLAMLTHELGNHDESLGLIQSYLQQFPNQPRAPELQSLYLEMRIDRAETREITDIERLISLHQDPDLRALLTLRLALRRSMTEQNQDLIARLKAIETTRLKDETAGQIKKVLSTRLAAAGDTSGAIRIWQDLSRSGLSADSEWGLRQLIGCGPGFFPVLERFDLLTRYLDRFYYSSIADQFRVQWLETALEAGKTSVAADWCNQFVAGERLFSNDQSMVELAYYTRARALQSTDPTAAMKILREYLENFPDGKFLAESYRTMALISRQTGDLELAASYFKLSNVYSLGKTGTSPEIADLYFSNGDYRQAIREYTILMNQLSEPDLTSVQLKITSAYYRLQNPGLAEKMEKQILQKSPSVDIRAGLATERADYLIGMQQYTAAIAALDGVIKSFSGSVWIPRALLKKCKALELDGKSDQAVVIYQDLIRDYPTSEIISDVYLSLGNYYFRKEAFDKAITNYKIIIDRYPTPVDRFQSALNNLIIANEKYGFYDRALEDLKVYIDRFPQDPEILDKKIKVGILLQKTGNHLQSITYLSQLLQGTSGGLKAEITYYLGETWFAKGDYLKAVEVFAEIESIKGATEQLDWITPAQYMTGQAWEKTGDQKKALDAYTRIVKRPGVDPIFKKAAQKEINRLKGN
ncbi:MAG: tetratricopeptide repeat protein [Bacteroidetes bacterium]|nr:tetratricopeptide repeat protein [Bacteroidota bacterium]